MKENLQKFLMVLIKSLTLWIILSSQVIIAQEKTSQSNKPDIKILFISGSLNNIELSSDCKDGFISELYDNRRLFDKIEVRNLYLRILSMNSTDSLIEQRINRIVTKIEKFKPDVIIALDDPSFSVICRSYWKLSYKPKIYYYGLTVEAKSIMSEKAKKKFEVSGIKRGLKYDFFMKIFGSKLAVYKIVVLTSSCVAHHHDKMSHNLVITFKNEFEKYNQKIRILSIKSVYDLNQKLDLLSKRDEKLIIFNMLLGLSIYDNGKSFIPSEELTRIISKKMKDDIVVSLTYRSAQNGLSISYGPNFYQDGKDLFNLFIDTYFNKTNKEIDSGPIILAFKLDNFNEFYSDLIYNIQLNGSTKNIFYY